MLLRRVTVFVPGQIKSHHPFFTKGDGQLRRLQTYGLIPHGTEDQAVLYAGLFFSRFQTP